MADNVAITAGSGTTIAADEVTDGTLGSVKVQYTKLMDGTLDGTNKAAVTSGGALKVDLVGTTANSTAVKVDGSAVTQPVSLAPQTTGGWTYFSTSHDNSNTDLSTTVVAVKTSAGTLGGWYIYNPNTAVAYVQIFDVAQGSVTLNSTRPNLSLGIPPSGAANITIPAGITFGTAISIAATTTPSGSSAPTTALPVSLWYK